MAEIEVPKDVTVNMEGKILKIKGKLGSASKTINTRLVTVKVEPGKIIINEIGNKKLAKVAKLAAQALSSEISSSVKGVEKGIERKMVVFYAHFPMTIEVKGNKISIKNIFGEKVPRSTEIIGDTKIEVKGQEVNVKGVDPYDVGQTVANIRKLCYARGHDTRVFQDGIYLSKED